ncbi:GNAT family N-acetyltransferase [Arenicella xantha]|uniref:Ribosomal protein S18 acetylase RimI-like enzyme n=1 Tax=Arenicella xantha TaxID=644221 RepID=A0A395JGA3_9GAMM|nr:N-acetyltransferase [Arenicella xantha]RBP48761.1 ribosomal protein S18 acetylase RimI-like enzyme [Arenicella xantha]
MNPTLLDQYDLTFRPATDKDRSFLRRLYGSTREVEMSMVPWTSEQISEFLDMQFEAQHKFYHDQFAEAEFSIIMQSSRRIGRLYLDVRKDEIRIIDIALVPQSRGRGFGVALLSHILDKARRLTLPVTIHVEKNNPAMSLYKRLGFVLVEDQGVYDLMRWNVDN